MPPFMLSCLTYLGAAVPGSTLGMLWPSMRISVHEPVSALAVVLVVGVAAQVASSTATSGVGTRVRQGTLVAAGAALMAGALALESTATALWVIAVGSAIYSTGFGFLNAALNVYAAARFGPRDITWMHASYGLGATLGPLLVTALLATGAGWRTAAISMSALLVLVALVLYATRQNWDLPSASPVLSRALTPSPPHAPTPAPSGPPSREPKGRPAVMSEERGAQRRATSDDGGLRRPGGERENRAQRRATSDDGGLRRPGGERGKQSERDKQNKHLLVARVCFIAVESGIEVSAGIWGYVFLTAGRGMPATVAGVAVSAYWAMMFAGRALLGPVAERAGASRVLAMAVAAVPAGALLMALPGPAALAVAGMMLLGLAAAPVFPLLTLTTADDVGEGGAALAVGLQSAASAIGSAALPSGIGLVIGAAGARSAGPALLVLGLAMCAVYGLALRPPRAGVCQL